jgi:tyrosine-protein phosphatase YwqE
MFSILKNIGLFKKDNTQLSIPNFLTIDVHSHLLPGLDDGSKNMEETIQLLQRFIQLGYKKVITTPHVMSDFYRNTPEIILNKLQDVRSVMEAQQLNIEIEAAAEYYLDEVFVKKIHNEEALLTFGDKYLLFETSFYNKPFQISEVIFDLQSQGYKPVFAHPERYIYLYDEFDFLVDLAEKGVVLQINLNSLSGYYGKAAQEVAEKLIDLNLTYLVGTDCHQLKHLEVLENTRRKKYYTKLDEMKLINHQL